MTRTTTPQIIPREAHTISRDDISPNALRVLYGLKDGGFSAYLVGGSVRDLLLGHHPKDFDVATNAHPEQIKPLFRRCILIGRRFRLAHVQFGREIIEVATFRADHSKAEQEHEARLVGNLIVRDNVYGTIDEDAIRRDFTINSLYYNIQDFSVVSYCNGWEDLKNKQIRMIGDPVQRYQEDPARMLRAIRFAAKLDFNIEKETEKPLYEMGNLIHQIAPPRLFDETLKLFLKGHAENTFNLLLKYNLFSELFPQTDPKQKLLQLAMQNSDKRINEGKSLTPSFIIAVLLWQPFLDAVKNSSIDDAIHTVLKKQIQLMTIPKRFTLAVEDMWRLQFRMKKRHRRTVQKVATHPRFRAAYDFLLLRAESGEDVRTTADWWLKFYNTERSIKPQDEV
ncbi:MAG TPA: polynucleotide adenylyltransferase PcnB [Gammaproteobacteria bacterium]|nr:polynucleotide adenylyltransferase PcnB [Gammaproteobacteria bacterium]